MRSTVVLIVAVAALACVESPASFDSLPIGGFAGDAAQFRGSWYDFEGEVVLKVTGPTSEPILQLMVLPGATPLRAAAENDGLHLWLLIDGQEGETVFRFFEDDSDVIWGGPPGPDTRPPTCGWGALVRDPSLSFHVEKKVERIAETCRAVKDTTTDWLIDHF